MFVVGQIDKLCLVLAAMLGLPFLMHMLPAEAGQSAGMIWLPIFYAPLIAVFFFRPHVAFLAGLLAPTINRLLTGLPDIMMSKILTVELLVFVFVLWLWQKHFKDFWFMGVVAYITAKGASVLLFKWLSADMAGMTLLIYFWETLLRSLPGLCVLTLGTIITLRLKAKGRDD